MSALEHVWPRNGGSAFPSAAMPQSIQAREFGEPAPQQTQGMSLRDYFAAKALGPMVAERMKGHVSYGNEQDIAKRAYEIADAMLAARDAS